MARRGKEGSDTTSRNDSFHLGEFAANLLFDRLLAFKALVPLLIGAVALTGAWRVFEAHDALDKLTPTLTASTDATVDEAWWTFAFDPEVLAGATNWQAVTRPELCVRLSLNHQDGKWKAAVCRQAERIGLVASLVDWEALGPGTALPWRDDDGEPRIGLYLHPDAHGWLQANRSWDTYGFAAGEEPSALEFIEAELDQPAEHLLRAWSTAATIPVRYNPDEPGQAMPRALLLQQASDASRFEVLLFPALFGALCWFMGWHVYLLRSRTAVRLLVPVVTLALLPIWGDWVWRGLDAIWPKASQMAELLRGEFTGGAVLARIVDPEHRPPDGYLAHPWTLETSEYREVFAPLDLALDGPPMAPDDALLALSARVREQAADLDGASQAALFDELARLEAKDRREAGLLFMRSARALALDEAAADAPRRAARRFLRQRTNFIGFVSAYRPAPRVRLGFWLELLDFPDNGVKAGARNVIDKSRREFEQRGIPFPEVPGA